MIDLSLIDYSLTCYLLQLEMNLNGSIQVFQLLLMRASSPVMVREWMMQEQHSGLDLDLMAWMKLWVLVEQETQNYGFDWT